jgi:septin family protein
MAPKKKEDEPQKAVLGRFSHNLKMGILGLPNVGKSTFFNTLTKLSVRSYLYFDKSKHRYYSRFQQKITLFAPSILTKLEYQFLMSVLTGYVKCISLLARFRGFWIYGI